MTVAPWTEVTAIGAPCGIATGVAVRAVQVAVGELGLPGDLGDLAERDAAEVDERIDVRLRRILAAM